MPRIPNTKWWPIHGSTAIPGIKAGGIYKPGNKWYVFFSGTDYTDYTGFTDFTNYTDYTNYTEFAETEKIK